MRAVLVVLSLFIATPVMAYPRVYARSDKTEAPTPPANAPFRAKLVGNAKVAQHAASTLASVAKQPAPASLSAADKKRYSEHSKWLADSAARLSVVHERMQKVLAKGDKAPATEVATMSMEFVNVRDALELEARRFADLAKPARARHATAMTAVRADK